MSPSPRDNTSNPAVDIRPVIPTFSFKSSSYNKPSEDDDRDQNKSSYNKLEDCCNNSIDDALLMQKDYSGSGRDRLKRHREEVAGRVLIPDRWGKEEFLKDWTDYSSFDSLLAPKGLASARGALMAEGRRTASQRLRIGSMC